MKKNILIARSPGGLIALAYALSSEEIYNALQVNQVASDPSTYSGTVTITGIMRHSPQDPSVFASSTLGA